jgi:phosphoglycerate kinase
LTSHRQIGKSLFDVPGSEKVEALVAKAGHKLVFPVDYITADKYAADAKACEFILSRMDKK